MTHLSLIVAMDENRLIGSDNQLPWHLPADLAFFKRTTMGKPILMGRKTYQSIGRPLPGRRNVVITRDPDFKADGCDIAHSIDAALAICCDDDEVMLIGGASLYEQILVRADSLYITHIQHSFKGDAWFPELDTSRWKVAEKQDFAADVNNSYPFSFVKYVPELY
jgi:dihydrofolate reductase